MCSECYRNNIDLESIGHWKFVDTLEVIRAIDGEVHGGCVKLQCLLRHLASNEDLRAHRALDDCYALRAVVGSLAGVLGVCTMTLLRPFIVELDSASTLMNIAMLSD